MAIPCHDSDRNLFAGATRISLGNGKTAKFWFSAWLFGEAPKDIAPRIFASSSRKDQTVFSALQNGRWVQDINLRTGLSTLHIEQFVRLWSKINQIHLIQDNPDQITWKQSQNGTYSSKSAYALHFLGSIPTNFKPLIWQTQAPPKGKLFAWLAIQNKLWTADRLDARGWPNQRYCPLCRHTPESALHLFAQCRFSGRIWKLFADWTGIDSLQPSTWPPCWSILDWWINVAKVTGPLRQIRTTTLILISWELWKERNARIFNNSATAPLDLLAKIKEEGRAWFLAGAKSLEFFGSL